MIEYFEWDDHFTIARGGWVGEDDINQQALPCWSVGKVLFEDEKGVVIAGSGISDMERTSEPHSSVSFIMKSSITKRKKLR